MVYRMINRNVGSVGVHQLGIQTVLNCLHALAEGSYLVLATH